MTKLTELPEITTLADGDLIYIVQASGPTSVGITKANFGGGLPAGTVVKEEIARITDPVGGEFDFNNIPAVYDRLVLEGTLISSIASEADNYYLYINGDTTNTNYITQDHYAENGAASNAEVDNAPNGGIIAGATAYGGAGSISVVMEDYSTAKQHMIDSHFRVFRATARMGVGTRIIGFRGTAAPITRLQAQSDGFPTDTLSGTLILYGERTL